MKNRKNLGKRILGMLLAVCIVLGGMPDIPVYADPVYTMILYTDESMSTVVDATTYSYTGEEICPYVQVKKDGVALSSDVYMVDYSNNTNAGDATVSVHGMYAEGALALSTNFKISKAKLDALSVSYNWVSADTPMCYYSSVGSVPEIKSVYGVRNGNQVELTASDYTVTAYNNVDRVCIDTDDADAPYLQISLAADSNYSLESEYKKKFYIVYNMANANVQVNGTYTYDGKAKNPEFTVKNGSVVTTNPDYVISSSSYNVTWPAGDHTNAGTVTARLNGVGKYRGYKDVEVEIKKANIGTDATVVVDPNVYDYTGSTFSVADAVKVTIGDFTVSSDDFTVDESTATGALGTNLIKVNGVNNLTGYKVVSYNIAQQLTSAELSDVEFTYTGAGIEPEITVLDRLGNPIDQGNYTVTYYRAPELGMDPYGESEKMGSAPVSVGTYYIKVTGRGFGNGSTTKDADGNYLCFDIVPKKISDAKYTLFGNELYNTDLVWNYYKGASYWPTMNLTITDGANNLIANGSCEVKYYSNEALTQEITDPANRNNFMNAGTYYIHVVGHGDYEGSDYVLKFQIRPKNIDVSAMRVIVEDQIYNLGNPVVPESIKVYDSSIASSDANGLLLDSSNYTYTCENNREITSGTTPASVNVTLTGNFAGTITGIFNILPRRLNTECTVDALSSSLNPIYSGEYQSPIIEVWDKNSTKQLVEGTDYKITYYTDAAYQNQVTPRPKAAGTYHARVQGLGYYDNSTGDVDIVFTIQQKPLNSDSISFVAENPAYTGAAVTPTILVSDSGKEMELGIDYEILGYYDDAACTSVSACEQGMVYVKIKGLGNYTGERTTVFFIGDDISVIASRMELNRTLTYNGKNQYDTIVQNLELYTAGNNLVEQYSSDGKERYAIHFYSDPAHQTEVTSTNDIFKNAGTVYIGFEGKNGLYGYFYSSATIARKQINAVDIAAEIKGTYIFNAGEIQLKINNGKNDEEHDGIFLVHSGASSDGSDYTLGETDYKIVAYDNNYNAGTATVTVQGQNNYTDRLSLTYTILPISLNDINGDMLIENPDTVYTSRKQTPNVSVSYTHNGSKITLVAGTDFTVEYYTNPSFSGTPARDIDMTNTGYVYVKIIGKGNYKDVFTKEYDSLFYIEQCDMSKVDVVMEQSYLYSKMGDDHIPDIIVRYQYASGSYYVLKEGVDYEIIPDTTGYLIGERTLSIKALGTEGGTDCNFKGEREAVYACYGDMATEIAVTLPDDGTIPFSANSGGVMFPASSIAVYSLVTGSKLDSSCYDISYENNTTVGNATIRITGNTSKYWSNYYTLNFKITGDMTEAVITIPDQIYTGLPYSQTGDESSAAQFLKNVKVECNGYTLTEGVDYKISQLQNSDQVSILGATATFVGIGDYFPNSTSQTVPFSVKFDITSSDLEIEDIPKQLYTGEEIMPSPNVIYHALTGDVVLNESDYTVSYQNNVNVGAASIQNAPSVVITATAGGRLTPEGGSKTKTFEIGKVSLAEENYVIRGVEPRYMYTGAAIKPEITVEDSSGKLLDASCYTVLYEAQSWSAGSTATVRVIGKDNYYDEISTTFEIIVRDFATGVTVSIPDVVYNGQAQEPAYEVSFIDYNGKKQVLKKDVDYRALGENNGFHNNVNAADAANTYGPYLSIAAYQNANYSGRLNVPFSIKQKDLADLYYAKVEGPVYQTGISDYRPEVTIKFSSTGLALEEGIDYRLEYYNNDKVMAASELAGPYILVIPNSDNFIGSYTIPFSIYAKDITEEAFEVRLTEVNGNRFIEEKWNYPTPEEGVVYTPQVTLLDNSNPDDPIELQQGFDYNISYTNNDVVGTAIITITATGNYTGVRRERFTIGTLFDETNISISQNNAIVRDEFDTVVYDGFAHVPENVSVDRISDPVSALLENVEYEITYYADADCTRQMLAQNIINAGTYYMKLSGLVSAGYIGSMVIPFTIARKSVNSADVIIDDIPIQNYGGGNVKPSVHMYDNSTGLDVPTSAYALTYENNDKIGTATAIITANENGNYTGTRKVNFVIDRQSLGNKDGNESKLVISAIPNQEYTGEPILPKPVVYFDGMLLEENVDYVLAENDDPLCGNNTKVGDAWVAIVGQGNYTGVATKKFKIKANMETATVILNDKQVYTGLPITPSATVICGGNELVEGEDFVASYSENIRPGDAYMIISPTAAVTGWYTGSKVVRFTICDTVDNAEITGIPSSQTYTGDMITPEPIVMIGDTVLEKDVDYSVRWNNAINVGQASVVITGLGAYAGTCTKMYNIIPKSIARCASTAVAEIVYDKKAHEPVIAVRDGAKILAKGVDYNITYSNNVSIGTAIIEVNGIGNYSGTLKVPFQIVGASMSGIKATTMGNTSVKLSWLAKPNVTGYEVYSGDVKTKVATTTSNAVTITKLKSATQYQYKVRTYTVIGNKTYYGAFSAVTAVTSPTKPVITVKSPKKKRARITWKKISGVSGYEVYASTKKSSGYKLIALIVDNNTVSYTNKGLTSKKRYYYRVRAYQMCGNEKVYSSLSSVKSVKVK